MTFADPYSSRGSRQGGRRHREERRDAAIQKPPATTLFAAEAGSTPSKLREPASGSPRFARDDGSGLALASHGELWVFGYGSLIWNPGFAYVERRKARLNGWSRRLCIFSHVYRGTPERPGLVLGLARGGSCAGVAFLVEAALREATIRYLREREQVTSVYVERFAPVALDDGQRVKALTYVADPRHAQFAGRLTRPQMLEIVRAAAGQAGDNAAYVTNVHDHLRAIGARDADLEWLALQLQATAVPARAPTGRDAAATSRV